MPLRVHGDEGNLDETPFLNDASSEFHGHKMMLMADGNNCANFNGHFQRASRTVIASLKIHNPGLKMPIVLMPLIVESLSLDQSAEADEML